MEKVLDVLLREENLVVGGLVIYFIVLLFRPFVKRWIVERWQDVVFVILTILVAVAYGFVRHSAFGALEALAGSQLVHALIKKGVISVLSGNKSGLG